ncbi:hypothetical protein [Pacificibacter marinus]|uniref:hypothetical protein n=1 Tax=Pacificibacter marinus TaxID=658057 RepID=UPI001C078E50|nr:hypothetical protein [Pacificibacter marinus]MBU2867014.1 hypothetical protein [Pacificibacter marinus]
MSGVQNIPQVSFNGGATSPLLYGRTDYQRYRTGVREIRGFIPLRQGGFTRAPGTIFRGYVKDNAEAKLVPFEFAKNDSLLLEFSDSAMRVWRYGALIENVGVYELPTPFSLDDVKNFSIVQSADVIYIADGNRTIQKLSRYDLDNWTIADWDLTTGPFRVQNLDEDITVSCSASSGTITLTGVGDPFDAAQVGSLLQIQPTDITEIPLWTANTEAAPATNGGTQVWPHEGLEGSGDLFLSDSRIYELTAGNHTGYEPPVHLEGEQLYNKSEGTTWKFVSDLIGVVRITAVTDANTATAVVIKAIPNPCINTPTYRWSEGAWSDKYGYPSSIEIMKQRFVAAATPSEPRTIWFSLIGDYDDHTPSTEADGAFPYNIDGSEGQNGISWLRRSRKGIYIGTLGEVLRGFSATTGQAIGPTTFDTDVEATNGASPAYPIAPNGFPIYVTKDQTRIEELRYSFEVDGGAPIDLSLPSEHLGAAGFEQIVWQSAPLGLAWIRRADGELVVMIYDAKEEVLGWAEVPIAGGFVESMAVSSSEDGKRNILTMVVRREINGATVRMVEEQDVVYGALPGEPDIKFANHLFASKVFDLEVATDTFDVPHLIGESVYAWTDEGQFGPFEVDVAGQINLPVAVEYAVVGLFDDTHHVDTHDVDVQAKDGDTRGKNKRISRGAAVVVHRTSAGTIRGIERHFGQDEIVRQAVPLVPERVAASLTRAYSGISKVDAWTGSADEVNFRFEPSGGAPMTVLALVSPAEAGAN